MSRMNNWHCCWLVVNGEFTARQRLSFKKPSIICPIRGGSHPASVHQQTSSRIIDADIAKLSPRRILLNKVMQFFAERICMRSLLWKWNSTSHTHRVKQVVCNCSPLKHTKCHNWFQCRYFDTKSNSGVAMKTLSRAFILAEYENWTISSTAVVIYAHFLRFSLAI